MKLKDLTDSQKKSLQSAIDSFFEKYLDVFAITVCTSDGFDLAAVIDEGIKSERLLEVDKISAMASTMCSLSTAASNHILGSDLQNTTIEAQNDCNIILVRTTFIDIDCVIFAASSEKVSLAELRFITRNLTKEIQEIK